MRNGFTLTELLVVLSIAAITAAIATPRLIGIADSAAVRDETLRIVAAVDAARGAAIRLGDVVTLSITTANGVTMSGAGQPITFGPAGLGMGVSNRTITLSKGTALRRIVVSKLGRLTY